MSDINYTPTTTELQVVEPDYKRAFGELSFLVASAYVYLRSGNNSMAGRCLERAYNLAEALNNYPIVLKTSVE